MNHRSACALLLIAAAAAHCSLDPEAETIGSQSPAATGWAGVHAMPASVTEASAGWHAFYGYPEWADQLQLGVSGSAAAYAYIGGAWRSLGTVRGALQLPAAELARPGAILWVALYPTNPASDLHVSVEADESALTCELEPTNCESDGRCRKTGAYSSGEGDIVCVAANQRCTAFEYKAALDKAIIDLAKHCGKLAQSGSFACEQGTCSKACSIGATYSDPVLKWREANSDYCDVNAPDACWAWANLSCSCACPDPSDDPDL